MGWSTGQVVGFFECHVESKIVSSVVQGSSLEFSEYL
jgi:hypothetical protein